MKAAAKGQPTPIETAIAILSVVIKRPSCPSLFGFGGVDVDSAEVKDEDGANEFERGKSVVILNWLSVVVSC